MTPALTLCHQRRQRSERDSLTRGSVTIPVEGGAGCRRWWYGSSWKLRSNTPRSTSDVTLTNPTARPPTCVHSQDETTTRKRRDKIVPQRQWSCVGCPGTLLAQPGNRVLQMEGAGEILSHYSAKSWFTLGRYILDALTHLP